MIILDELNTLQRTPIISIAFLNFSQSWAEAHIKIARMTLTIKLDGNWNSFQLANNTPPLGVTGSVIAPSARIEVCVAPSGCCGKVFVQLLESMVLITMNLYDRFSFEQQLFDSESHKLAIMLGNAPPKNC